MLDTYSLLLNRLTEPHPSISSATDRQRVRFFASMILFDTLLSLLSFAPLSAKLGVVNGFITTLILVSASLVVYGLSRTRYFQVGIHLATFSVWWIVIGILIAAPSTYTVLDLLFP